MGADANGDQGVVSANTEKAPLGESWFDEEQRIHATRDALREVLGVSLEWNPFDELWALASHPDVLPGQESPVDPAALQPPLTTAELTAAPKRVDGLEPTTFSLEG